MKTAFEILQSKLTIADTSEFRLTHIPEILDAMEEYKLQQMEISDGEIEKSMRKYNITDFGQMAAYVTGAKWYHEKLKQRK